MTTTEYTIPELPKDVTRGPQWLSDKRNSLRLNFNDTPLPRRGLKLWRYTDPAKFAADGTTSPAFSPSTNFAEVEAELRRQLTDKHIAALVIDRGGREITTTVPDEIAKSGIVILPLAQAVSSHTPLIEPRLYQLVNSQTGKFEALNGALWQDGIFVYVPDNKTIELPIHLMREAGAGASRQFPRLLVVVGKNAQVTLVDEYSGGSTDAATGVSTSHGVVEIFAGHDSRVQYLSLQRQTAGMNSYLTHRARIEAGAQMVTIPLAFGGNLSKQNFGVILDGAGADSRMFGLAFGTEHQQFDNHTLHHHAAGPTTSNIDFKVVLRDKAMSAYTGLIRIDHSAKGCQAYQENRNLLLTPGARAESVPELEILNEDVSCTHGATVGPIDPMQVFYLNCRGIDHDTAVRMVVAGFLNKTLQLVPEEIRDRVASLIQTRLEAM
jgi:Fe-S cluster assembly protein SufD